MKTRTKVLGLMMAAVLLVSATIFGTMAYLTDKTEAVVNTFTAAGIEVTLTETKGLVNGKWEHPMLPGASYDKDPIVTVTDKTTTDCYLFVKFDVEGDEYLTYTSTLNDTNGWTLVPGEKDVWYRTVKTTDETKSWNLLEGDTITVNGTAVTKENMNNAANAKLTYTAYAVQLKKNNSNKFTVQEAWDLVNPENTTSGT